MKFETILPVILSVIVIVSVAVLERQSKLIAAITTTMPISAPLALWIIYSANQGSQQTMERFTRGLLLGVLPTLGFLLVAWLTARAGFKLAPMLAASFSVWAVGAFLLFLFRRTLGY